MKTTSIKILSTLLVVALATNLLTAMPISASAGSASELAETINSFDPGNGEAATGQLTATVTGGNTVTVTGDITGATEPLTLDIDDGVTVIWKSYYTGSVNTTGLVHLREKGTFEAQDSIINYGNSCAIYSSGENSIIVSNGVVGAAFDNAIIGNTANTHITVSGGAVFSRGSAAISTTDATSTIAVSGGLVFGVGTGIYGLGAANAIRIAGNNPPAISGDAIVCAWNRPDESPEYYDGSPTDLIVSPSGAFATWGLHGMIPGVNYINDENTGFLQIDGVTVNMTPAISDTPGQDSEHPDGTAYLLITPTVPVRATFEYGATAGFGSINRRVPITVRCHWGNDNSSGASRYHRSVSGHDYDKGRTGGQRAAIYP